MGKSLRDAVANRPAKVVKPKKGAPTRVERAIERENDREEAEAVVKAVAKRQAEANKGPTPPSVEETAPPKGMKRRRHWKRRDRGRLPPNSQYELRWNGSMWKGTLQVGEPMEFCGSGTRTGVFRLIEHLDDQWRDYLHAKNPNNPSPDAFSTAVPTPEASFPTVDQPNRR